MASDSLALRLSEKRSEMMSSELEDVALRLFEQRGFHETTVEEIAVGARISVRTFYRYFPSKEDVLQLSIERRSKSLQARLAARPADEPPLRSLRVALTEEFRAQDADLLRRWIAVIAATPSLVRGVLGGIQLNTHRVVADFLRSRLDLPADALLPTILAGAAGGVIQAAQTNWFLNGGDLSRAISEGLEVLENGMNAHPTLGAAGKDTNPAPDID
ncbi:TetR family transcriptional regulator [Frankia sp. AgB1.9]|uniref:TetR family transcriptional regulator n=1 Tax=unclassified Frankia TaxID=2632575 RepID=UPI001933A3DB|nr:MULTISPECIES: TetR family transcriptional regulator [unclassified Frankia]MBL7492766.1 TetR family transcriptional regulator [Frankia sp. AgW1.1]MBL7549304.1 TetR family transcriptional regulator [Frankia sp. AgB1.9]MBL7619229.1 TetR family transcriptional regulator [Frankia sp. AgB1.8]